MELDFEKLYKISLTALRLNRSHPEIPKDIKWILQFSALQGFYTIAYLSIAYNVVLDVQSRNYSDAARNGVLSIVYFVVSFQYFILVFKRDTLKKIMDMMKNDFEKNMTYDEKMIVLKFAIKGKGVCRQWLVVTGITGAAFFIKHIVLELNLYVNGEFRLLMLYPLTFPTSIEEVKMQPMMYTIIYLMFCYYVIFGSCMYTSFVPLGPSFMLHACGQLELVKKKALGLYKNKEEEEEVKDKLVDIVKHLQYIYYFIECIEDSFKEVYEMTLKGSTLLLPVALYEIVSSIHRGELSVEFLSFLFSGTLFSSTPCYYSDMLMEKGEEVRLAIYSCGWEAVYDHGSRTTITLMLQRALRPTSIRTVFRPICLDALTDVFRQSYAIFNLMNAAWG